jgi:hypothetical protein
LKLRQSEIQIRTPDLKYGYQPFPELAMDDACPIASCGMLGGKQEKSGMPVGMFRSEEGWVQVEYGTGNIPITRSKYGENKYKPDFE